MLNILRNKSVVLVAILGLLAIFAMGCTDGNFENFENEPMQTDPVL